MGKVIIAGGGGSGAGSDECTATRAELLKGYTAVTGDSDNEALEGTLEFTGDAADSQVLAGKTYYNMNPKNKRTGSMVNQGAVSQTLNVGESYVVPAGYHNGSGKVMANSLASQTPGNATAASIINGDTAWVNGNKITGNIASIVGQTINPTTYQQTVSCFGKYMTGNIVVNAVSNLSAANIKKGVNVGGTVGTFEGYVPTATDLYSYGNNIAGWYDGVNSISLDSTAITIKDAGPAYMVTTKAYEHAPYSRINIIALVQRQGNGGCSYGFQDQRTAAMFAEVTNVTTIGEYTVSIPFKVSGVMTIRLKFWNYYTYAMQIKRIWLS